MKVITLRTPDQVREDMGGKKLPCTNNRVPVIVTIPVSAKRQDLGVQFWNAKQICDRISENTDGSISKFVELY